MSEVSQCQNCQTPLEGPYCYKCGQSTRGSDRFFLTLINEAFEDIFSLNSRVWKTFGNLLWHPGFLSNEYYAGRRVRYIPPVRLYFTLSILFFLVYTIYSFFEPTSVTVGATGEQTQSEIIVLDDELNPVTLGDSEKTDETTSAPASDDEEDQAKEENSEGDDFSFRITDEDETFDVPWLNDEEDAALKARLEAQAKKAKEEFERDPDMITDYFLDLAPPVIFALLPVFALLLKIVYITKGMYYTQHLVLAVHNHCFIFLWMTLIILINWAAQPFGELPGLLDFLLMAWGPFYLWRSLRNVYGEGRFLTFIKYLVLAISYWTLIGFAAGAALLFGIMTI